MWRIIVDGVSQEEIPDIPIGVKIQHQRRLEAGRFLFECEAERDFLRHFLTLFPPKTVYSVEEIKEEGLVYTLPFSGLRLKLGQSSFEGDISLETEGVFGTGFHPSTRLSLDLLDELALSHPLETVLDLGAGSGVLSLVAAGLGASQVVALEIDPKACLVCRKNIYLNHFERQIQVVCGTLEVLKGAFKLVLANIYLRILLQEAESLRRLISPGGHLICAGFLAGNEKRLEEKYTDFKTIKQIQREGWAALLLEREK